MNPIALITDDGRVVDLTDDGPGWVARHNGYLFHVTATSTGPHRPRPATPEALREWQRHDDD